MKPDLQGGGVFPDISRNATACVISVNILSKMETGVGYCVCKVEERTFNAIRVDTSN